jgi:AcrR family transcriptional regulator
MLNMRSASEDRSTKERIRDAAIRLFGRDGFAATTVRSVAADAEVSPGLVIHHFGSKAGLRQACDEFVITGAAARSTDKADPGKVRAMLQDYLADPDQYAGEIAYVRQSLADQSGPGDQFFDSVVRQTRRLLRDGAADGSVRAFSDTDAAAVVIAANSLAILLLGRNMARVLGTSDLGPDMMRRITVPTLELYTYGFYTGTAFLDAARSVMPLQPPAKAEESP